MKKYTDLDLGFSDASNYRKSENKELLNKFFYKDNNLEQLLDTNKYFLIGAKGTGKTALSVYLANNEYKNTVSSINYIRETEYVKFINLKKEKALILSDYCSVWKVLLLLLLSMEIDKKEGIISQLQNFSDFSKLKEGVSLFYQDAFSPEIITALTIVEQSEEAVSIFSKLFNYSGSEQTSQNKVKQNFQLNLLSLEHFFKKGMERLKLQRNHILFVDGIDIRPRNIEYEDYLECVKGLANAVWELNNDFFSKIKGSKSTTGRIRVVVLLRPDIFSHLGLHNLNNKVRDNSVLLNWNTTYTTYQRSALFALADRMLSVGQPGFSKLGAAWNYYFPYDIKSPSREEEDSSFVSFLRFSWSRPRDIVSIMKLVQDKIKASSYDDHDVVNVTDFDDPQVRMELSNYLLGEIKDYLAFYHSDEDYELFLKFFTYLDGKYQFTYKEYMTAYDQLADYIEANNIDVPILFESSGSFLQFLYDLDVICYVQTAQDGEEFLHWSYRERTYSNVNPKVIENVSYRIHYGLRNALSVGKVYKTRVINRKNVKVK